jgi:hypothetical protein
MFSAANYNDVPHDQRAIDRKINQFGPHQQVGTVPVSFIAHACIEQFITDLRACFG